MAVAFVQDEVAVEDSGTSFASIVKAFGSSVTTGNLIIVSVGWGSDDQTPTITDNQGNTYTLLRKDWSGRNQGHASYYAKNVTGGSVTVTASFSPSAPYNRLGIMEVSGADAAAPLGQANGLEQGDVSGTDGISSGSVTTLTNGEFVYGVTQNISDGGDAMAAGTGFTLRETIAGVVFAMENLIQSAAGQIVNGATFTPTGTHSYVTHIATFKAAAGPLILTGVEAVGSVGSVSIPGEILLATIHQSIYRG